MGRRRRLKVVMLGEGRVGKTSLLQRFANDAFDENNPSTVKATMFTSARIDTGLGGPDGVADVAIWDTAGQEQYHALGPIYYRDAHGAVLVYDITDRESFTRVRRWIRELHQVVGEGIQLAIVGNKVDLERERKVDKAEAEALAEEVGAAHILASARLGVRVADIFQVLTANIVQSRAAGGPAASGGGGAAGDSGGLPARPMERHRGVRVRLDETPMQPAAGEKKCPC